MDPAGSARLVGPASFSPSHSPYPPEGRCSTPNLLAFVPPQEAPLAVPLVQDQVQTSWLGTEASLSSTTQGLSGSLFSKHLLSGCSFMPLSILPTPRNACPALSDQHQWFSVWSLALRSAGTRRLRNVNPSPLLHWEHWLQGPTVWLLAGLVTLV